MVNHIHFFHMDHYYGIQLTPEFYNRLHEIGYHWVTDFNRYNLLMISINCRGCSWDSAKTKLQNPSNMDAYKHGPSPREAWIDEVNSINSKNQIKLDYSTLEHLTWQQKMKMEQDLPDRSLGDSESMDIYNKWLGIWSGRIQW